MTIRDSSDPGTWSFPLRVVTGNVNGWSWESKFGSNSAVGGTEEDIWNQGGTEALLSAAEQMDIASTLAADKGTPTAGTGARTLVIFGLASDYEPIRETIILNGASNVRTVNSYLRVHRMIVTTAGSGGINAGDITATAASAGSVHAKITAGNGQTQKTQYCVPANYYAIVTGFELGALRNDEAIIRARVRELGAVFAVKREINVFATAVIATLDPPFIVSPKSDMKLTGTNTGAGNISITAAYQFYLVSSDKVNM